MTYQEFKAQTVEVIRSFARHTADIYVNGDTLTIKQLAGQGRDGDAVDFQILRPDEFPFYTALGLTDAQVKAILPKWDDYMVVSSDDDDGYDEYVVHTLSLTDLYAILYPEG